MKPIYEQQNTEPYLELIRAFKNAYSKAKLLGAIRVGVAVASAGVAPIIVLYLPSAEKLLGLVGAICTIICEWPLETVEDGKKTEAAKIQEQFDVGLFNIRWNKALAGEPVEPEKVAAESREFNNKQPVKDWYNDTGALPFPLNVLLCQRSSLVWDSRQRRHFSWIIGLLTLILFSMGAVFSVSQHQTMIDYLLSILAPSVPLLLQGVKAARAHASNAEEKDELVHLIQQKWDAALENPSSVTERDCREIQDRSFCLRKDGPMTPDLWHMRHRARYEADMQAAVTKYRLEAEKYSGSK